MKRLLPFLSLLMASGMFHTGAASEGYRARMVEPSRVAGLSMQLELKRFDASGTRMEPVPLESPNAVGQQAAGSPLKAQDLAVICFTPTATGYASVWHHDYARQPVRIFPNAYSAAKGKASSVQAGERVCIGDQSDFRLRVTASQSTQRVYIHWTASQDAQIGDDEFLQLDDRVRSARTSTNEHIEEVVYEVR